MTAGCDGNVRSCLGDLVKEPSKGSVRVCQCGGICEEVGVGWGGGQKHAKQLRGNIVRRRRWGRQWEGAGLGARPPADDR